MSVLLEKQRERIEQQIPKFALERMHVQNLRAIANRKELLEHLPKDAIVAEIGVDSGLFTDQILLVTQPSKLHLIDIWDTPEYPERLMEIVLDKFNNQIKKGAVEINRGWSTKIANDFKDGYFDWIYIDSDHSYNLTKQELEIFSKKVKRGGIIAGHDFIQGSYTVGSRFGVIEAVSEFCVKNNWEIIFLTMDYGSFPSFAIQKI